MTERSIDYSTRDYEGFRNELIELLKIKIPEYSDFSKSDAGIVLIELLSHGLDINAYYNDVIANEVFMETAKSRSSVIKLANQIGYTIKNANSTVHEQVIEITPSSEPFLIEKGLLVTTSDKDGEEPVEFEVMNEVTIPPNSRGNEVDENGNYLYSCFVKQGITVEEEVLGTSRETPDQTFTLGYVNALDDSLIVYVKEGLDWFTWNKVDSFLDSSLTDRDYMISVNELGELKVIFGNGTSGKIPPRVQNGIVATYRVGGGDVGNVAVNKITELPQKPALVKKTYNVGDPIVVGEERESNESAKIRSTAQLRTLWRAVTIYDFADVAYELDFVKYVIAIENDLTEEVDVYVLPKGRDDLTSLEEESLVTHYNQRKLIGIDFTINSPVYKEIDLSLHVKALHGYTSSAIQRNITEKLNEYFKVGNIDFGEEVILSNLIKELVLLEGVRSVSFTSPIEDIPVELFEIPKLNSLEVEVVGGVDE